MSTHGISGRRRHSSASRVSHSVGDQDPAGMEVMRTDIAHYEDSISPVVNTQGQLHGTDQIIDGSLSLTPFADTIRPVAIVDVLPTLPDPDYPEFSYAVLTSDERLYKNIGDVWVLGVDGADIVADSITAGQIAAGAIGASEISAGSITADKLAVGVNANMIANGSFEDYEGTFVSNSISLITDPASVLGDFWVDVAGASGLASVDLRDLASNRYAGENYIRIVQGLTPAFISLVSRQFTCSPGDRFYGYIWLRGSGGNTANARGGLQLMFYDASGGTLGAQLFGTGLTVGTSTTWTKHGGIVEAPAGAAFAEFEIYNTNTSGAGDTVLFDGAFATPLAENVSNIGATVVIDDAGILISNGALTIEDEFGSTVAGAGGFSGGWADFMRTGLYNGNLATGTTGTITLGRTADLPYWTTSRTAGTPNAQGFDPGVNVSFSNSGDIYRITSDRVEITAGLWYYVPLLLQFVVSGSVPLLSADPTIAWYDSAGGAISITTLDSFSASFSVALDSYNTAPVRAPSNAYKASVRIDFSETVDHDAANRIRLFATGLLQAPPENLDSLDLSVASIATTGAGNFGSIDSGDIATTGMDVQGETRLRENVLFDGIISPTALTGNVNDWGPSGLAACSAIRYTSDGTIRTVTGLVAPSGVGQFIIFMNVNATVDMVFGHLTGSSANNQIVCPGSVNYTLGARDSCILYYDTTSSKWRIVG
jgi:hypothetical protein